MNKSSNKLVDRNRYNGNLKVNNYSIHLELIAVIQNKLKEL